MQYGFVINQQTCIGCHACTVACKAENNVPVGGFRTSVKYTEVGAFPDIRRLFLVQRCNQCTDAPCVTICPVNALSKRKDGIVDIDRDACIGCRACMQACPYDAIYLNEDIKAVEKCHFCAHRVENGLEPACVTVCPVGAIVPGDFDDPSSRVSLLRKEHLLKARRPEQGTGPNVFYLGAEDVQLNPGAASKGDSYLWSQRRALKPEPWPTSVATEPDAREVLAVDHKIEWGWPVALYLLTKGIAAGAAILAPFLGFLGVKDVPWWMPETVALVFSMITVFLLIEDLAKPMHFYKLFTRPNWKSWLVKGGIVLTVFCGLSALILLIGFLRPAGLVEYVEPLRWANAAVGLLVAGYTAFLFRQCKGRDLWEGNWLFTHLILQAIVSGTLVYMIVDGDPEFMAFFYAIAVLFLLVFMFLEQAGHHPTDNGKQAAAYLLKVKAGPLSAYWLGVVLLVLSGIVAIPNEFAVRFGCCIAALGLFLYEYAFVRAGQLPPLS